MLSRVANSVYWTFRYVERAENVARFLEVNYNLSLGAVGALAEQWSPLVYTTGDQRLFFELYSEATRENVVDFLAFRRENPNSILSCVEFARENARTIRDVLSSPMWEQLNKFYHMVRAARDNPLREYPYEFCSRVKLANHVLIGVTDSTMSHGEAWHFGRLGRLLERADKTSRIVDVQYYLLSDSQDVGSSLDVVRWSALLKSASALEMYRQTHGKIVAQRVADFLILNRLFPRSMHYCLIKAMESMRLICGSRIGTFTNQAERRLGRLVADFDYATIDEILEHGLHEFIDDFQRRMNETGVAIHEQFFTTHSRNLYLKQQGQR
jgi:uncharacterized alpha-E superfamily protein